jgi:sigma-B regulation protein RsbU (phosphoserine phosphatase)
VIEYSRSSREKEEARLASVKVKRFLFAALTVVCLVASISLLLYYYSSFWYGFGVDVDETTGAISLARVVERGPAEQSGLLQGDVILRYNGRQLRGHTDLLSFAAEMRRTSDLKFTVLREGKEAEVILRGEQPPLEVDQIAFILVGCLYIALGWWVFYSRPNYQAATAWGLFSLLMGNTILVSGRSLLTADLVITILVFVFLAQMTFAVAAALHFALVFPQPGKLARRRWAMPAIYAVPSAIWVLYVTSFVVAYMGSFDVPESLQVVENLQLIFIVYMAVYFSLTVIVLIANYFKLGDRIEKRRIRWIIFGTAIPLGLILGLVLIIDFLGVQIPYSDWLIVVAFATIPVCYFYAIVRHRAMQMELIIRRGLIYSIVTVAVLLATAILYAAVIGLMFIAQDLLPAVTGGHNFFTRLILDPNAQKVAIAVWALFVGATVGKVKRRAQDFVDRRFYREKYNYRRGLQSLASVLEDAGDKDRLLDIIIEHSELMAHPQSIAVALLEDGTARVVKGEPEVLVGSELNQKITSYLVSYFADNRNYLGKRELEEESPEGAERARESFAQLGSDLCLPIRAERGILGFIFCGPKRSGLVYNTEEIELLSILADQAGHGLEHLRLVAVAAERERIKQELSIGRRIQRSLLPSAPPRLKGASIAAQNIPAMEVGGDFYAFVEYDSQRVGIVVGDIVGKGVPGALNMAATISLSRLIAEESGSVAETMQRLNRYLVRHSEPRSFAAIIFAVLDLKKRTLTWSNAGLPEPVLVPVEGPPVFLEMAQYPLPPGASPRSAYLEARFELAGGEKFVFLTDGMIEACSSKDPSQDFGYERILQVLAQHRHKDPQSLLQALAAEISEFSGSEILEDDFTAVVVDIDKAKGGKNAK